MLSMNHYGHLKLFGVFILNKEIVMRFQNKIQPRLFKNRHLNRNSTDFNHSQLLLLSYTWYSPKFAFFQHVFDIILLKEIWRRIIWQSWKAVKLKTLAPPTHTQTHTYFSSWPLARNVILCLTIFCNLIKRNSWQYRWLNFNNPN